MKSRIKWAVWITLLISGYFASTTVLVAQTNSYIAATDGFWDEARLWSLAEPPSLSQSWVYITNAASVNVTIDNITATEFPGALTISNLTINSTSTSNSILYLDNTGTNALHIFEGLTIGFSPSAHLSGGASLISTDSTLVVDGLLGGELLDNGTLIVAGGSLIAPDTDFYVGKGEFGGQCSLFISNATVQANSLTIALGSEGPGGTVELFGGVMTLFGSLTVGETLLGGGGNMLVTGGALLIVTNGGTGIGVGYQSYGIMTISNSTFLTTGIGLGGQRGSALLVIDNGTVNLSGELEIGTGEQGSGTVSLNGGALIVTNGDVDIGVGDPSSGNTLTVNDGLFLSGGVTIGAYDSLGALSIFGGTSILSSSLLIGTFNSQAYSYVNGGQLVVTNAPIVVNFGGSCSVFTGQLVAQSIVLGSPVVDLDSLVGTLLINGGSVTVSEGITMGDCGGYASGNLSVEGGDLIVTNSSHNGFIDIQSGQLTLNSGTLQVDTLVMTNTCSQFVHTGGTLIVGNVILDPNAFRIVSATRQSNDVLISWLMAPGATNALQATTGSYATNNFSDIFIVTNNTATGVLTNFLDLGAATNKSRYYRARLSL